MKRQASEGSARFVSSTRRPTAPTVEPEDSTANLLIASSMLRGLSILDSFSSTDTILSVGELSRRLSVHKSTISRLAAALAGAGYLQRVDDAGRFRLGPKLVRLGVLAQSEFDLRRAARPALEALIEDCGETAHVGILDGYEAVTVDFVEGRFALRMHTTIGKRSPAYCSAIGKVVLAYKDHGALANWLSAVNLVPRTPRTHTRIEQLEQNLREIAVAGYAYDNEELETGMRCVGAPVFDATAEVIAAISISGPTTRINSRTLQHIADVVKREAGATSSRLGAPARHLPGRTQSAIDATIPESVRDDKGQKVG